MGGAVRCASNTGTILKFWELFFSPHPQSYRHGGLGAAVTLGNWGMGAEDPSDGI